MLSLQSARNLKLNKNFNYKNLFCREKDCFFPLGKGEKCKMFLALNKKVPTAYNPCQAVKSKIKVKNLVI